MRICTWNIEWFDELFKADASFEAGTREIYVDRTEQDIDFDDIRTAIAEIIQLIDPDAIMVVEAPGTTASTGKSTIQCLQNFSQYFGLRLDSVLIGYASKGSQEIALWYDTDALEAEHDPMFDQDDRMNGPFDEEFIIDSDLDGIKEIYSHYRPPLEAKITPKPNGDPFWLVGVHAKSKGIFSKNDLLNYQREVAKNRRRLFAECGHIRQRVERMLDAGKPTIVLGDINDGPGMDYAELRFGRSAVELIMGSVFEPTRILASHVGEPEWGSRGFEPSSARFRDRFTEDYVNVLIDHILASNDIAVAADNPHQVWNPYQVDQIENYRRTFTLASDHFPITLDLA